MKNHNIRGTHRRRRVTGVVGFRSLLVPVCAAVLCGVASGLDAATSDPAGYTPILYVYQKNELVDVKTFKIADLEDCQRRASALLELYLNHSDMEDDMRLVVRCVPVPPPSAGHRKGERAEADHRQRSAEVTL